MTRLLVGKVGGYSRLVKLSVTMMFECHDDVKGHLMTTPALVFLVLSSFACPNKLNSLPISETTCREIWYQYTCGHIKPAEGPQESWEHCDDWTTGQDEDNRPNNDANEPHETLVEDRACPEG